jgi:hypothetical protein
MTIIVVIIIVIMRHISVTGFEEVGDTVMCSLFSFFRLLHYVRAIPRMLFKLKYNVGLFPIAAIELLESLLLGLRIFLRMFGATHYQHFQLKSKLARKQHEAGSQASLAICFLWDGCVVYASSLEMGAVHSSERYLKFGINWVF